MKPVKLAARPVPAYCAMVFGLVVAFASTTVHAASLINLDQASRQVLIEEAGKTQEITVAPNQRIENICNSRCVIGVAGSSEAYEAAASDEIAIEFGELYFQSGE